MEANKHPMTALTWVSIKLVDLKPGTPEWEEVIKKGLEIEKRQIKEAFSVMRFAEDKAVEEAAEKYFTELFGR